jgi:hypothetical protein
MVRHLLPGVAFRRADAADALAIAICHAHHRQTRSMLAGAFSSQAAKLGDSENATKQGPKDTLPRAAAAKRL